MTRGVKGGKIRCQVGTNNKLSWIVHAGKTGGTQECWGTRSKCGRVEDGEGGGAGLEFQVTSLSESQALILSAIPPYPVFLV